MADVFNKLSAKEKEQLRKLLAPDWFEEATDPSFILTPAHKALLDEAERKHRKKLSKSYSWKEVKAYAVKERGE